MNRLKVLYPLLFVSALFFGIRALGQSSQSYLNDIGGTAYGINIPVENGFINISNGNLHLEFPLATHPQRGALALNERITYDSRIWMFSPFGSKGSYHWWPYNVPGTSTSSGGWQFIRGDEVGTISSNYGNSTSTPCPDPTSDQNLTTTTSSILWTDPNGTVHPFNAYLTETENDCSLPYNPVYSQSITAGNAADGSGYFIKDDGNGNPLVTDNNGAQVYPQVIDRYGNYFATDGNGNLKDDTGQVPVIITQNGNTTYYDVLAPNGPINNNGTRVRYTVTTTSITVNTDFVPWQNSDIHQWSGTLNPIQSILLPDGSQYSFGYNDVDGELTSVTLPSGGTISYGYSNFFDSSTTENRLLTSRTVGSNPATTFTPSVVTYCANYSNGCIEHVTVHKPSGDETVYELTLNNGAWNTGVTAYTGPAPPVGLASHQTGTYQVLSQTTNYNTYTNGCTGSVACYGGNYLSQTLSTAALFTNSSSAAVYKQTQSFFNPSVGKVSDVKEWDYVSSSPSTTTPPTSTPTRETQYSYTLTDPYQVKVLDSSGTQAGLTTYGYTTSATATSNITQHGTQNAGGPYLQSVSHWLNTGGASTVTYTMDDTGQVLTTVDANGNTAATMTYQCANSLPRTITNALNPPTTYSYDCYSGAIQSVQDPNDAAAQPQRPGTVYAYEATAGRPYTISYPDGGLTTYSYPSATEVDTTVLATPDPAIFSQDIVDSFGRKYQHIQSGVSSETSYDANGRVSCTTNPHATGSSSSTDGSTCVTAYDGLDRPLTQQQPDGSTLSWAYSGATTASTDEAGNQWQRTSDAFGHLTTVVEPGSLTTTYAYDGLGNIKTISQAGNGSTDAVRTRTFTYDSMSRLLCESHPESSTAQCPSAATSTYTAGTIGYGYDPNGNQTSKTDARGLTVTSTYDALNRLWTKTGPGVDYKYTYDVANAFGFTAANPIGRLVVASNTINANIFYSYDAMGRVLHQEGCTPTTCASGVRYPVTAAYDLAGNITSLTYPDGRTVTQSFDSAGRMYGVNYASWGGMAINTPYQTVSAFAPTGQPNTSAMGNGIQTNAGYDNRLRLASLSYTNGTSALWSKSLAWTPNGNLQLATDNVQGIARQFTYDNLNRLTAAQDIAGTSSSSGETTNTNYGGTSNALQNPQQFGALGWGAANASLTANSALAPDGTMTAGVLTANSGSTDTYMANGVPDPALYDGASMTASVWLKLPAGSGNIATSIYIINVGDQGWSIAGQTQIVLTPNWQQFQVSATNQNGLSTLLLQIAGAGTVRGGQVIDVWGAEMLPAATSSANTANILTSPQVIVGPGWGLSQGNVTNGNVYGPNGTTGASEFTAYSGGSDSYLVDSVQGPSAYNGAAVSASVWLRAPNGPFTLNLYIIDIGNQGWGIAGMTQANLTTSWQQFHLTGTLQQALTGLSLQIGGASTLTNGQVIDVWGPDMQANAAGTPGTTNILPSSQQVIGSSWGVSSGWVVANSAMAPDGSNTATIVTADQGSADSYVTDSVVNPSQYSNQTVTASVYLRVPSGSQSTLFCLIDVGANGWDCPAASQVALTTAWQRFQLTATMQNGVSQLYLQIGGAGSFTSGQSVEFWGAQIVVGSTAGNYVPTTATTTNPTTGATEYLATNGLNESYSYDSFGNLQQSGNFNFAQAYTVDNRVSGYSYDAAGNMLSDGLTNTLEYDAEGRVVWDSGTVYIYDPMGQRVSKSGAGVTATDTIYFGGRPIARNAGGAWTDLIYGTNGLLAEVPGTQNGAPVYRMTDHLGSTAGLLSASGAVVGTQDTVPFGQLLPGAGTQDADFPFTGLEHDPESGFDHATYRQYASAAGRWLSPDPYTGSMDLGNPQSLNRYNYAANNPLRYTDPSGLVIVVPQPTGGSGDGDDGDDGEDYSDFFAEAWSWVESKLTHPKFHGSTVKRPPWDWHNLQLGQPPNIGQVLGLPGGCEFGACGNSFAGPGMEDHHIFPQAFQEWFEQHGIDIESYTIALTKAAHRLKPGGLHTKSGGNWNARWKQWIDEHPNASPQEILNQGKRFLIEFGVGAGDVFSDFFIIVNPCVTNPNMPQCQIGYNLTVPIDLVTPQPATAEGM